MAPNLQLEDERLGYSVWAVLLVQRAAERKCQSSQAPGKDDGWTVALGRPGQSTAYPEKLLKSLEARLKAIAKGEEEQFSTPRFRRSAALMWSNWSDSDWLSRAKSSRKLEDLLLSFVASVLKMFDKDPEITPRNKHVELDRQLDIFVNLLEDVAGSLGAAGSSFQSRLEALRLSASKGSLATPEDSSTSTDWPALWTDVQLLFGSAPIGMTERFALQRLNSEVRERLSAITTGYQGGELEYLQTLLADYGSLRTESGRIETVEVSSTSGEADVTRLQILPPYPRQAFSQLLALCLDVDLEAMANLEDTHLVSLGILSERHKVLLGLVGRIWNVDARGQTIIFGNRMIQLYLDDEIPLDCVLEAMSELAVVLDQLIDEQDKTVGLVHWAGRIALTAGTQLQGLQDNLLALVRHSKEVIQQAIQENSDVLATLAEQCTLLSTCWNVVSHPDWLDFQRPIQQEIVAVADILNQAAIREATFHSLGRSARGRGPQHATDLHEHSKWIYKETKKNARAYPAPIDTDAGPILDIAGALLAGYLAGLCAELHEWGALSTADEEAAGISPKDVFEMFGSTRKLLDVAAAMGVAQRHVLSVFELSRLVKPYVQAWINSLSRTVSSWVDNAAQLDSQLSPVDGHLYSSAVVDVFASLRAAVQVYSALDWTEASEDILFTADVASVVRAAIQRYSLVLRKQFLALLNSQVQQAGSSGASPNDLARPPNTSTQSLDPRICTLMNNVEAAMRELDELYGALSIEAKEIEAPAQRADTTLGWLFSLKVLRAEGIGGTLPRRSKAAVAISSEGGTTLVTTRQVFADEIARWDEEIDIDLAHKSWLMITLLRADGLNQIPAGRSFLKLDPQAVPELAPRTVKLSLDNGGTISVRVTMEAQRHDPRFHFGRAFRALHLERAAMVRMMVDAMLPVVYSCLSWETLKGLAGGNGIKSATAALKKLSTAYIPAQFRRTGDKLEGLTTSDVPSAKSKLTDAEIEKAIGPMLDYFDANLQKLSLGLSAANLAACVAQLWREIILAIEGLIIPPLSDQPSSMRALSDLELDITLRWLKFLRDYFYAQGDDQGVPLEQLQNYGYNDIMRVRLFYDWPTDDLMEECVRQRNLEVRGTLAGPVRVETIRARRNLKTITHARKQGEARVYRSACSEILLRILRMRSGTADFLRDVSASARTVDA